MIYKCENEAKWHPTLHTRQRNHIPPTSWRRDILAADPNADQSWWYEADNCGLCHDEYHTLLNRYVKLNGPPPWEEIRTYSYYVRDRVALTWLHRVKDQKMPYTVNNLTQELFSLEERLTQFSSMTNG